MTTEPPLETPPPDSQEPEMEPLPKWVAAAIGVVLVVMAGLAVFTGFRFRETTAFTGIVKPRRSPAPAPASAPPGEPQPGASLIYPGDDASNTPNANAPVTGRARAEISGGGTGGVQTTLRLTARRGMMMKVTPADAMVSVNDLPIGAAQQFSTPDQVYDFPQPGSYTIRITAPGFRDRQFIVTVADDAKPEVVHLEAALAKE